MTSDTRPLIVVLDMQYYTTDHEVRHSTIDCCVGHVIFVLAKVLDNQPESTYHQTANDYKISDEVVLLWI